VSRRYYAGGGAEVEITAATPQAAAQQYVDDGSWPADHTTWWCRVRVADADAVDEVRGICDHPRLSPPTQKPRCDECGAECDCEDGLPGEINRNECPIHGADNSYEDGLWEWLTVAIHPPEPECSEAEHSWAAVQVIVHGSGVVATEECCHCGATCITDTWAYDPLTGEQGLRSERYERYETTS